MRAVNTPKVLYRHPGQKQYEWVDLWESYVSGHTPSLYCHTPSHTSPQLWGWEVTPHLLTPMSLSLTWLTHIITLEHSHNWVLP